MPTGRRRGLAIPTPSDELSSLARMWLSYTMSNLEPVKKPDSITLMEVSRFNSLRGYFIPLVAVSEVPEAIKMFRLLGLYLNADIVEQINEIVINKNFRDTSQQDSIFLGVNDKDMLCIGNSRFASGLRGLRFLENNEDYFTNYMENRRGGVILCENLELAMEFLSTASKLGYNTTKMEYPFGRDTCYDIFTGNIIHREEAEKMFGVYFAQEVLYKMEDSLFRFEVPEGGLRAEELVRGRLYQQMFRNSNNSEPKVLKFNGNLGSTQDFVDRWGDYYTDAMYLDVNDDRAYYIPPTSTHRQRYHQSRQRQEEYLAEVRREERVRYMRNRERKLKNKKNNITTFNRDVETQLLSESLHKVLTKALDNKVARCLLKLNSLGYLSTATRNITIRSSDKEMTYMPSGKPTQLTGDGHWVAKGRQNGKYGKIIRKVLTEQVPRLKFTDQDIEQLVNHLKAESADGDFEIVKGEDIRDWYHYEKYHDNEDLLGTLNSSCMKYEECQDFLDIYVHNPDVVKMVILTKDEMLVGRALLWKDKYMDRIYGTDATIKAFKNYAKEKGFFCKASQNSDPYEAWLHPETGKTDSERITINLKTSFDKYPYADTFCYIDLNNNQISNTYEDLQSYGEMRDTSGDIDGGDMVYDEYDDRNIHIDDSVIIENHDYRTHYDNAFECEIDGCYYLRDERVETHDGREVWEGNVEYVESGQTYAESHEIYTCEHDGNAYIESMHPPVFLPELEITVMEDNVEDAYENEDYHYHENSWRSREDLESDGYVEVDGEWVNQEDTKTV